MRKKSITVIAIAFDISGKMYIPATFSPSILRSVRN